MQRGEFSCCSVGGRARFVVLCVG